MGLSPEQSRLDALDEVLALFVGMDTELQAVATRIANRARTRAEADDVRSIVNARATLREARAAITALTKYGRTA